MNDVLYMLATPRSFAQIVPEFKGEMLSEQDTANEMPLALAVTFVCALTISLFLLHIYRRKQRRHYRSR
jgi:hypothetical protein